MADWIKVGTLEDCPPGSLRSVMVGIDRWSWPMWMASSTPSWTGAPTRTFPCPTGRWRGPTWFASTMEPGSTWPPGPPRGLPAVKPVKTFPVEVTGGRDLRSAELSLPARTTGAGGVLTL